MLSRLSIALRLLILVMVPVVALVIVGMTALASIQASASATVAFDRTNSNLLELQRLREELRANLSAVVSETAAGMITLAQAEDRLRVGMNEADSIYAEVVPQLTELSAGMRQRLVEDQSLVAAAFADALQAVRFGDPENIATMMPRSLIRDVEGAIATTAEAGAQLRATSERISELSQDRNRLFMGVNAALGVLGLLVALILGYFIARSMTDPIQRITGVVRRVAEGDFTARAQLQGYDEIVQLGNALDTLLHERVTNLALAEEENAQLNDSVIGLLRAVSQLSKRDLTVRVPVTEDVTGPVADAINQLTTETNRVLLEVARVADQVAAASAAVNEKANLVNQTADAQGREVAETAEQLATAAARLTEIAEIARQCNDLASRTTEMTESAVGSVDSTLSGMNSIREAIQETGKRIKRLGDRSQEISGVVDIINQITERTTVLALNASMQAAAAGEAGRGFAVVADEVQRLAESSRNATGQIATLVKSIQVETNDTMSTMDEAINQVIEGSKLAEEAGRQMGHTRVSTNELVQSVMQIAASSQEQSELSNVLRDRASGMLERTAETSREVHDQLEQTGHMAKYSQDLLTSVRQFQLAT
jgi:methyl-accepting chemotaxis protein